MNRNQKRVMGIGASTQVIRLVFILGFGWVSQSALTANAATQTAGGKPDMSRIASLIESLRVPGLQGKEKMDAGDKARVDAAEKARVELAKIGEPAVELLIAALKDPDREVQKRVAFILGEIGDGRAVTPLIAVVQGTPSESNEAIWSLGRIKDPGAVEVLVGVFSRQTDGKARLSRSRTYAANALGEIGDHRAVETLLRAAKEGHLDERIAAIIALGKIRDHRAVEPLSSVLDSTPPPPKKSQDAKTIYVLRRVCVWALGELRTPEGIPSLMRALRDQEFYWVSDPTRPRLVSADSFTRFYSLGMEWEGTMAEVTGVPGDGPGWALGKIGDPAVEPLLDALNDKKLFVREASVIGLGYTGSPRVVEPLIALMADKKENIRWLAAEALSRIADARATVYLLDELKKPNFEAVAAAHLFFIWRGVPGSEPTLIKALDKRGTPDLAINFMNSGNTQLKTAAEAWSKRHGYRILTSTTEGHPTKWGAAK